MAGVRDLFAIAAATTLAACTSGTAARSGDAGTGGVRPGSGGAVAAGGDSAGDSSSGGASSATGGKTSGVAGAAGTSASGNGGGSGAPRNDAGDGGREPEVPVVPVGPDAYGDLGRLPTVKIGTRTYMRSTYDRAGGNDYADASHFLRMDAADRAVTIDVAGQGYLYFARANRWHGSPWHYVVDGTDDVVQESSTADPTSPVAGSTFIPVDAFPEPLALTWSVTRGADLSWVPVPFQRSLKIAYEHTHYGTGYFIYQLFPDGAENASRPPSTFALAPPDPVIANLLSSAGQDQSPAHSDVLRSAAVDVPKGAAVELFSLHGARTVRAFTLHAAKAQASALAGVRLRITWDGRSAPSVDAPLPLFFGAGTLYNRDDTEWLVKSLLLTIHEGADIVDLATYFPMPFFTAARVELVGGTDDVTGVTAELRTVPNEDEPRTTGYFHATYVDHGTPTAGEDLVVLDTKSVEGGGDLCGSFNGMSFVFSDQAVLSTLEGDPRFFFDDSGTPQAQGTGTEEWAGGGDYWSGQTMTLPLAGHPVGAPANSAKSPEDAIESAYRLLVADAMPFGKSARIQLEHGGTDESTEHYRSVAYWYAVPGACLVLTDSLHVGDAKDETAHRYVSPTASNVESITSRYEVGVDHVGTTEVVPESTDTGRHMTGASEFRLGLDPHNVGALLRRKLDYAYPDQRADVFVADDRDGAPFVAAGTWYLAGSNSCVLSFPAKETDPAMPVVQTSNRRFRDDEFLVPRRLTEGRSAVRLRVEFRPLGLPLMPGSTPAPQAWSELRYWAYSWVLPDPH
jgi:hypothetical protein